MSRTATQSAALAGRSRGEISITADKTSIRDRKYTKEATIRIGYLVFFLVLCQEFTITYPIMLQKCII